MKTFGGTGRELVATVVVNWHGYADTADCLSSLASVTYAPHRVVVVDNESQPALASRLRRDFPEADLIANEANVGFAAACNQGAERALSRGASYVFLLNNDAQVQPDTITRLVAHLQAHPEAGAAGPLITYHDTGRIWFAGGRVNLWTGRTRHIDIDRERRTDLRRPRDTQFVTGCALMARATLWRRLGGLDERYFAYFEDVDFCHRARAAGWGLAVVPDAVVAHKVSASAGHRGTNRLSPLQAYLLGRNRVLFARARLRGAQRVAFVLSSATLGALEISKRGRSLRALVAYWQGLHRMLLAGTQQEQRDPAVPAGQLGTRRE